MTWACDPLNVTPLGYSTPAMAWTDHPEDVPPANVGERHTPIAGTLTS